MIFFFHQNAHAAQVTLAWDPNTEPDLAGYEVHYGSASRSYQGHMDVGNNTQGTITGLQDGATYYISVTAYDSSGNDSGYSNEVVYNVPLSCSSSISPASQSFPSSGGTGTVGVTTSSGCAWTSISNTSWIVITSNAGATGSGTTYFSVSPNSTSSTRTGTLTIAGRVFTVSQSGASSQYSLTINKAGTGSGTVTNSPTGSTFNAGTTVTLTATASADSTFGGWSGACSGTSPTCTVRMNANASVTAAFNIKAFTITATAGANGSISPQGAVSVNYGSSRTFTVTPNSGYKISDVRVDGVSVGAVASYSISNVTANRTIAATFAANSNSTYSLVINKTGTGSGTVTNSPTGSTFNAGTAVTLTASPNASSTFAGWSGACTGTSPTCTVQMNANASVTAAFNIKAFTITATAGANGSISPQGAVSVNYGSSRTFTVTPNSGYKISDVKVDGVSVGAVASFLFGGVMSSHTIEAVFSSLTTQPGKTVSAMNAGGNSYVDSAGVSFSADKYYQGGQKWTTSSSISGTQDDPIYQSERYGNFYYSIPVSNGNYIVTLKFAENYWSSAGQRKFNVKIEGNQVITNLDIFAKVGKNRAYDVALPVSVKDGVLRIEFVTVKDNAKVSAILVQKAQ